MITLCHAAKGGSGTSLVAAIRAIDRRGPTLLVDLEGDSAAVLGVAEPDRPGVVDWLASEAPVEHLDDLLIDATRSCRLLPATANGHSFDRSRLDDSVEEERWEMFADWLATISRSSDLDVTIDAGTTRVPPSFAEACDHRWLVTRPCYLSLRRASRLAVRPTGVVLIDEPGRSLRRRDVETAVRCPVVAELPWDPRIARAVDAGLLSAGRVPKILHRTAGQIAA